MQAHFVLLAFALATTGACADAPPSPASDAAPEVVDGFDASVSHEADAIDASDVTSPSTIVPPGWTDPTGGVPAAACERTLPIDGSACTGALACTYPDFCDSVAASAKCVTGKWRVTLPTCPKCPPPTPHPGGGSPCTGGKGCRFLNACGGVDSAKCVSGAWRITPGACHKACPPSRPLHESSCGALSADSCTFAGTECSTSECTCVGYCPTVCADGVVLRWFCPEPYCGPVYEAGLVDSGPY